MFRLEINKIARNWNRFSLLIVSSFLSFLQVNQFRNLSTKTFSEHILEPLPFQDSPLYLFQLKRFLEGIYSFGDGAILEKANSGYSAGSSFIFAFWGTLGNLLNINLVNTYTLMVFISSALLFFVTYLFLMDLGLGKISAQVLGVAIYVLAFGYELGRPSPTQQTLWMAILAFSRIIKLTSEFSFGNVFLSNSLLFILLLCNPVYSLPVFAFYFLSVIALPLNKFQKLFYVLPATLTLLGFNLLNLGSLTPEQTDQLERFGVFHSRLPGAFNSSVQLLVMATLFRYLPKGYLGKSRILLFNLNVSMLAALNSQVLTNTNFEMQSHLGHLVRFTILASLFFLATEFLKILIVRLRLNLNYSSSTVFKASLLLLVCILATPPSTAQLSSEKNSSFRHLISKLAQKEYMGKVFVVPIENMSLDVISYLALNSGIKLYWYPEAVYSVISDRELFERFACTRIHPVNAEEIQKYESILFAHKYVNREQFYPKWNSLLVYVGLRTSWRPDRSAGYINAQNQIANFQKICHTDGYSKKADYLIDKNLNIRDISAR